MQDLFFELIRVSIGTQDGLSRTPSAEEWEWLYTAAKNQMVEGICFAGVQRLSNRKQCTEYLPELLYARWMFTATKIQQQNETLCRQCAILTSRLLTDGFDTVILKGQSIASKYGALATYRQTGDIDIWLSGDISKVRTYIFKNFNVLKSTYNHAEIEVFNDTKVEAHFTPSWLYSPFRNRKLQKWFSGFQTVKGQKSKVKGELGVRTEELEINSRFLEFQSSMSENGFKSPTLSFDLVYLMLHSYRHLMHEGLWIRQIMDYYFVLKELQGVSESFKEFQVVSKCFKDFGLSHFAGAMMYVMKEVFGIEEQALICKTDEKRGRKLLNEIVRGDNMRHEYDPAIGRKNHLKYTKDHLARQMTFLFDYPNEVLWSPLWKTWQYVMRKLHIL